jgi:hypothetical protein
LMFVVANRILFFPQKRNPERSICLWCPFHLLSKKFKPPPWFLIYALPEQDHIYLLSKCSLF